MTLQSKDGFQNGITWTTCDFWKKKRIEAKFTWTSIRL